MRIRTESGHIRTSDLMGLGDGQPKVGGASDKCLFEAIFRCSRPQQGIRPESGQFRTDSEKGRRTVGAAGRFRWSMELRRGQT